MEARWRDVSVVSLVWVALLLVFTRQTRLFTPSGSLQILPHRRLQLVQRRPLHRSLLSSTHATHDYGTWQADTGSCSRGWNPAFQPFSPADQRLFAAPALRFFQAAAKGDAAAQKAALRCLEHAGLPAQLFTQFSKQRKLRILLAGDSVDRRILEGVCSKLGAKKRSRRFCDADCETPLLHLSVRFIPGSSLSGPWPMKIKGERRPLLPIMREYLTNSTAPYDVVLISSAQWDLNRLDTYSSSDLDNTLLPPGFLQDWRHNITQMLQTVQAAAPAAVHMWRTTAAVEGPHELAPDATGPAWHRRQYINQQLASLNDAGRAVALDHGFLLQDLDAWTRNLDRWSRLRDGNHPKPHILLELFNRILLTYFSVLNGGGGVAAHAADH